MIDQRVTIDGRRYSRLITQQGNYVYRLERMRLGVPMWVYVHPLRHQKLTRMIDSALGIRVVEQ